MIEVFGIEDSGDSWDIIVVKKFCRKKVIEDDEDYVNSFQLKFFDEDGVNKVMVILMQCKEKWIVVKLFICFQVIEDEQFCYRVVRMYGYQIFKMIFNLYKDDINVVLQVFDIFYDLLCIIKNKIVDFNIEVVIQFLIILIYEEVVFQVNRLFEEWSKFLIVYCIFCKEKDVVVYVIFNLFEECCNMDCDEFYKYVNNFLVNLNILMGLCNKVL